MHINNEIGTMQPLEEIGEICAKKQARSSCKCLADNEKHHGPQRGQIAKCTLLNFWPQVFLHTDAAQSVGKAAFAACMP